MNKKEAKQRIHNLEEELAELKHLLDQPEGRWRAEIGGTYWSVMTDGRASNHDEEHDDIDSVRHRKGNYFQTEEHAKASNLYKILNDPYEYYIAGVSDNWDDVPRDGSAEWYRYGDKEWASSSNIISYGLEYNYRWKK